MPETKHGMSQGDQAVAYARAQLGKPYVWATAGPATFDCSGLVYAAYRSVDPPVYLGRTTYEQIFDGTPVSKDQLAVGDLVFPYSDISHVAIYSGGGNIIESPAPGLTVRERQMTDFFTARRVGTVSGDDGGSTTSDLYQTYSLVQGIPNPLDPFGARTTAEGMAKIVRNLTSRVFWLQFGTVTVGIGLIIWGILFLNRSLIYETVGSVVRIGREIGGTIAQGYAFGLGAGATGTGAAVAASSSSPPSSEPPLPVPIRPRQSPQSPPGSPVSAPSRPRPLPNPSGLSDLEMQDRLSRRLGFRGSARIVPRWHRRPLSEGGMS